MTANGLHYHCLKKSVTKCKAKCTIVLESVVEDGVSKNKYIVEKTDELENHNHAVDEADIIAADMVNEMHKKFRESLTVKPSVIRKQIMQKYRAKYSNSSKWGNVMDVLPDKASIDRGIARIREKVWGKMPLNRAGLDYQKVLDTVDSGSIVEVMASEKMWENILFRQDVVKIGVLNGDFVEPDDGSIPANPLERTVVFTSNQQLEIFATSKKGSVDGNFKVPPLISARYSL